MKRALITGITGQDGSYLAELLLSKGYEVHGLIRRSSTFSTHRIDHIYSDPHIPGTRLLLHYGDLSDASQLTNLIYNIQPDEVYHLGAQSHVKVSFEMPEYTGDVTGLGTVRLLEAIRRSGIKARYYQASSSEMFGTSPPPQSEKTAFYPRSPYGAAKVYSYWCAVNYRESYNMYICNGILFNHECVTADTPVIMRHKNGLINISPIEEIVTHREDFTKGKKYTTALAKDRQFEVWDGTSWTKVKTLSATWNDATDDKGVHTIISRGSVYSATKDHISFLEGEKEIKTGDIVEGSYIEMKDLPNLSRNMVITDQESELIGMMVADGYISPEGKGRLVNNDENLRQKIASLWLKVAGGSSRESSHPSGYTDGMVGSVELFGNRDYLCLLRKEIYTEKGLKKIPVKILNSDNSQILAFLQGYNACDGLKCGNQKTEFKSFTTNSSVLAAGLFYLMHKALNLRVTLHPEFRGDKVYYHLNINSDCKPGNKGEHLKKPLGQVKGVRKIDYVGWLFDLETESGTFSAGIGLSWIHNSPRRGETFVTRKITRAIAHIVAGKQDCLYLGNIKSKRDWGFAPEYVECQWRMLQQERPDDYVVGTGESRSVEEFVNEAFSYAGLDPERYVRIDEKYFRPTEVDYLLADISKAKKVLEWTPRITFKELVKIMVDADMEFVGLKSKGEGLALLKEKGITWTRNQMQYNVPSRE